LQAGAPQAVRRRVEGGAPALRVVRRDDRRDPAHGPARGDRHRTRGGLLLHSARPAPCAGARGRDAAGRGAAPVRARRPGLLPQQGERGDDARGDPRRRPGGDRRAGRAPRRPRRARAPHRLPRDGAAARDRLPPRRARPGRDGPIAQTL
ncbi:MAG: Sulfate permease, partial [uncultured Solirubrobacterales bacterium]